MMMIVGLHEIYTEGDKRELSLDQVKIAEAFDVACRNVPSHELPAVQKGFNTILQHMDSR